MRGINFLRKNKKQNMNKAVNIIVHGLVQGVFYRAFTKELSDKLGIKGWVRNLPNGCVEVEAHGCHDVIEQLINILKIGPKAARVDELEIHECEFNSDYNKFDIKY